MALTSFSVGFCVFVCSLISESVPNPSNTRDAVDATGELPISSPGGDHSPDVNGSQVPPSLNCPQSSRGHHLHQRAVADD